MTNINKAKIFGKKYAEQMYADFREPNMKGPNFTWKKFPHLAKNLVAANVYTMFKKNVKNLNELKMVASIAAYETSLILINNENKRFDSG